MEGTAAIRFTALPARNASTHRHDRITMIINATNSFERSYTFTKQVRVALCLSMIWKNRSSLQQDYGPEGHRDLANNLCRFKIL